MHNDLKNLLIPYFIDDLKRYGSNTDGGYIFSENLFLNTQYIYSYGIGGDETCISFDRYAASFSKDIYMYDESINNFWGIEDRFHFYKENVNSKNIYEHIIKNNHTDKTNMILKMDIEGGEYETLLNCDENLFCHFNQIALEVHGIITSFKDQAVKLFQRLNQNYYLTHIHGNNNDTIIEDGICNFVEVSYIRKDCFKEQPPVLHVGCPRDKLDFPNYPYREDIRMNWWLKNEI